MKIPVARQPLVARGAVPGSPRPGRATARPGLVALGDLMLDVVVAPVRGPERGTDVPGIVGFRQGGSAANTARTFARLGGRAALVAAVGDDIWARSLATSLRSEGVRMHLVKVAAPTGRLAALVGPDGERSFVTQRGAADALRPSHLEADWFGDADVLHVPAYSLFCEPLSRAASRAAGLTRRAGGIVSVDLSSRGPLLAFGVEAARTRMAELGVDVLFADRGEAAALLGSGTIRALPRLVEVAPLVVVKAGAQGCRILWRGSDRDDLMALEVVTSRVAASDTTGAGDAFAAGFLHALLAGGAGTGGRAGAAATGRHWTLLALRRAALAGHRASAALLRGTRPWLALP